MLCSPRRSCRNKERNQEGGRGRVLDPTTEFPPLVLPQTPQGLRDTACMDLPDLTAWSCFLSYDIGEAL